ncbi:mannose-1-phosphate guanylyltransferase/mannose-6-phosphate isomerase [Alcaligenaceae bacterium]|nr:mannose-1-phosphate guanylyltransferase/mannose-6-phosphate isomerase [Alcaligenaceae bacterium]
MDSSTIIPVILCGGAGTRLWPLSRKSYPKQFVPLINGKSLLQLTLERVADVRTDEADGAIDPTVLCVASEEHRFLVAEAMAATGVQGQIILEPIGRNTAPAMAIAALIADPEDLLLFCPSDHYIPDLEAFADMVANAVAPAESGSIVTFGVVPSTPSTAYGYIEKGDRLESGVFKAQRFLEKPDLRSAQALILQGNVLWNAGIFLVKARVLLDSLNRFAPAILSSCTQAMSRATIDSVFVRPNAKAFAACRAQSIDYAVMEHSPDVAVAPFIGAWSDVGSWTTVAELIQPDEQGNRIEGQGLALQAEDTYINAPNRLVVALGTKDLMIIDTADALLVAAKGDGEAVRDVVATLAANHNPAATVHRKVARPWGWYDTVDTGDHFLVKRISVKPGASLSLQKHQQRAEHWVVVKGIAQVTRGDETFSMKANESTYIPIGEVHRLANPGEEMLEMIEVQTGEHLSEDDIVRLDDSYGRC